MLVEKKSTPAWLTILLVAAFTDALCTTPLSVAAGLSPASQIIATVLILIAVLIWLFVRSPDKKPEEEAAE